MTQKHSLCSILCHIFPFLFYPIENYHQKSLAKSARLLLLKQIIKQTQLIILWHIAENAHFVHFFD